MRSRTVPPGTAENTPGRQSWATYMGLTSPRDNPRSSIPPRGDMFSAAIRILSRVYPGRVSWDILIRPWRDYPWPHVHPGLTSWATLSRPCGTQTETGGSHADTLALIAVACATKVLP